MTSEIISASITIMASTLTRDDVERVARLARLDLHEDEIALFTQQIADILQYVDSIQAVDTSTTPPTAHALAADTSWRDDVVAPSLSRDAALENAPDARRDAGMFRVPKVAG
jgi:aspartyl-tRNA(Asn)/glutamyl-tRNA(Gln) amidotransferase subunit C